MTILEPLVNGVLDHLIGGPLHWLPDDATLCSTTRSPGARSPTASTKSNATLEIVTVSVDLAGYAWFDVVRLADGTEVDQFSVEHGHLAWRGPDGWLEEFQPGDLLAVNAAFDRPTGDEPVEATITITVVADEPAMTDDLAAVVRAAYDDEQHEHGLPVSAQDLIVWLCHHHPRFFTTPLPPLSDWFDAAGLELNGSMVAHDVSVWRRDLLRRRHYMLIDLVSERQWREVLGRLSRCSLSPRRRSKTYAPHLPNARNPRRSTCSPTF